MAAFDNYTHDHHTADLACADLLAARQRAETTKVGMASPAFQNRVRTLWACMLPLALKDYDHYTFLFSRLVFLTDAQSKVSRKLTFAALMESDCALACKK